MLQILNYEMKPNSSRIGIINVRYHDLLIRCSICVFRQEKIFIRMPEMFLENRKYPYCGWLSKEISADFQKTVLKYLEEEEGLTLSKALDYKTQGQRKKKTDDKNKKSI